ncbi:hypothetical protein [Desulfobacter latus]|uniref:Uncharacterized protein n=1 Tax=Desulfobacter latus TaxID=2292 RepID=A0A850T664_9BACT|nr:hypothetical protein [Desulfobacter latus]NWH04822.1 hypothetical protein [Desulfobacter latus]
MGQGLISTVKKILGNSGVKDVRMETQEDLELWLDERKRYRDMNKLELRKIEEKLDLLFDQEEKQLKAYGNTIPKSTRRKICLEKISRLRKEISGFNDVRTIREKNIDVNATLLLEIEKSKAVGDLGLDMEQTEAIREKCEKSIEDWGMKTFSSMDSWATNIYQDDSALDDLERELDGINIQGNDELDDLEKSLDLDV